MTSILKLIHKSLSDADIRAILGKDIKLLKYSELSDYDDLDDLMPSSKDCCIILYEDRLDRGHWVALSKYVGIYEHFDSYGIKPDGEPQWISMKKRRQLGQVGPKLTQLLLREKKLDSENFIWKKARYQNSDESINTCGSHVCHRLYRLMRNDMDLRTYHEYMLALKQDYGMPYNVIVAEFVNNFKLPSQ